ncbi:hypothetical protein Peur_056824 [Populus x canadensis]
MNLTQFLLGNVSKRHLLLHYLDVELYCPSPVVCIKYQRQSCFAPSLDDWSNSHDTQRQRLTSHVLCYWTTSQYCSKLSFPAGITTVIWSEYHGLRAFLETVASSYDQ